MVRSCWCVAPACNASTVPCRHDAEAPGKEVLPEGAVTADLAIGFRPVSRSGTGTARLPLRWWTIIDAAMGGERTVEHVDAPRVETGDVAARASDQTHPIATASPAHVLQRTLGNRGAGSAVQRHGTGHPHTFRPTPLGTDVRQILTEVGSLVNLVRSLTPDPILVRLGQVPDVAAISVSAIWSADRRLTIGPDGTPIHLAPDPGGWNAGSEHATTRNLVLIADPASLRIWVLGAWVHPGESSGGSLRAEPFGTLQLPSSDGVPGAPFIILTLPDFRFDDDPELVRELEASIDRADREAETARRRRTRPPAWARQRTSGAADRAAARRRGRLGLDAESGSGTVGEGPGSGERGTGSGGGPASSIGVPLSEAERRQRVSIRTVMGSNGEPAIRVDVDGVRDTLPLREQESDDELDRRLDELEQRLGDERDPNLSRRVAHGASTTEIREVVGATAGRPLTAEEADRLTGSRAPDAAPGERVVSSGRANAPAWPARLELFGINTSSPVTVVAGATNQAAMVLDRGPNVLDYFQRISYTWELINVTDAATPGDRIRMTESTGVGESDDVVERADGHGANLRRQQGYIAEDIAAESWPERFAALNLIALSAGIRTIGNVVSSIVTVLSEPLNERSIPWGEPGEYVLRCVATPISTEEALADPERHVVRASSVKAVVVRVVSVADRAVEVNNLADNSLEAELARLREELRAAQNDDPTLAAQLAERIAQLEARINMGAVDAIGSSVSEVERQIRFCTILADEPTSALEIEQRSALMQRHGLSDAEYGDLHEFRFELYTQNIQPRTLLRQLEASRTALRTRHRTARQWSRELKSSDEDHRPRVTLVSEETGRAYTMITMLGEHRDSRDGAHHWVFYDLTSAQTQKRYHGRSSREGIEGRNEAIRAAFVDFRENAQYGRGTIAVRMPNELADAGVEERMRAAPGEERRWRQRLTDLATAAEIGALVVASTVTGGATLAAGIGIVGGVAGATVAINNMRDRSEGDRLDLDYETFNDILAIVGLVASAAPSVVARASRGANSVISTAIEAGDVGATVRHARRLQRYEMVGQALHVFDSAQGLGQTVFQIPYDIVRQFTELEAQTEGMSPGERRARAAMILLNGFRSGAIGVIGLRQSFNETMPTATTDLEIGAAAAQAGENAQRRSGGPTEVPLDVVAPATPAPATPAAPSTEAPRARPESTPEQPTTEAADGPTSAPNVTPTVSRPPMSSEALSASQLISKISLVINRDRSSLPPTGRISIHPAVEFVSTTGQAESALGALDPSTGQIRINQDVLLSTPGLVASLERLVIARAHPQGRRSLGDEAGSVLARRMTRSIFGDHPDVPGGTDSPVGREILNELAGVIGSSVLQQAYFHGDIGAVRDQLRDRYGFNRTDEILGAVRSGSLGDVVRLLEPSDGGAAMTSTFGDAFATAVGRLVQAGDPPRRHHGPALELAQAIASEIGIQPFRDAHFSGDLTSLTAALRRRLAGDDGFDAFTSAVRDGDFTRARASLRPSDAAGSRQASDEADATLPAEATASGARFAEALREGAAPIDTAAASLLRDLRSFALVRQLVDEGAIGGPQHVDAARDHLQRARVGLVDDVLTEVIESIRANPEFAGAVIVKQDLGTVGFLSDRDVTLRASSADSAHPVPPDVLIRASFAAVREAYARLRQRGFDPAEALDTNFYSELHESAIEPASAAERMAISADQTVVSLIEIEISAPGQLARLRRDQLEAITAQDLPDHIRAELTDRIETQFATAERRAAELTAGGREQALEAARTRLEEALQRTPPPSAREVRQLMAEVKLLEPDAYGTRAAVEGVVLGQQAYRGARTPEELRAASRHVGPATDGAGTLTERLEHRLQQARASLGHLLAHAPKEGTTTPTSLVGVAKQLGRIAHAFRESGLRLDNPLINETGAVVAAKGDNDPATIVREVRGWAERTNRRRDNEQQLLDAYVEEATRLAIEMTTRMGVSTEMTRSYPTLDIRGDR